MTALVYAWPPVGVVGAEWTEVAPVQVSRSMLTGAERVSAIQRKRRMARLSVPGVGRTMYDAGYMEMLKRYLAGVHLVRLHSYPINWYLDAQGDNEFRQSRRVHWRALDDQPLNWSAGNQNLYWFSGTILYGSSSTTNGRPTLTVSDLPPNTLVARPGEFVQVFGDILSDVPTHTYQVVQPSMSNNSGVATVYVFESHTASFTGARISLGVCATGVFRPVEYPRSVQPLGGNWTYDWEMREVFEDEVGGFTEVNPWIP